MVVLYGEQGERRFTPVPHPINEYYAYDYGNTNEHNRQVVNSIFYGKNNREWQGTGRLGAGRT